MNYISTWGVYPSVVETVNWVHEEDIEEFYAVTAHGPRVFQCIAEIDSMLVLQYGDKTFRVNPRYYRMVAEPLFKLREEVYIPRKDKNGIILNINWHSKNKAHMYYLMIEGKKYSRRYYEDELRKLDP